MRAEGVAPMTMRTPEGLLLTRRIGPAGLAVTLDPNAEARARLAASLGIEAVPALHAELFVKPRAGDAYAVTGTVAARVVQACVVTLAPVEQSLAEEVDVMLFPAEDGGSVFGRPEDQALRDTYAGGRIDLDAIVAEHVALGLDPYPRAPGVAFEGHIEDAGEDDPSPFAALARLNTRGDRRD